MKIAFISAAQSIHIVRWANAMAARGHEVAVLTCKNHMPAQTESYEEGVRIIPLKFSAPLGYYLNAGRLKKIVKKEKFDIINVHYASGYATLARRAKLKDALLNIWGSDVYEFPYASAFNMRTSKKNLAYFKGVASTSNCMARQAESIVNREYFITPFGVDISLFKPMPELKPENEIIFGTVKTLSPKYGIEDTVKAFIILNKRLVAEGKKDISDKLRYEIYGRGELKDKLQQLIDENSMQAKIKLCGYVQNSRLPEIYNRFTVCNCNSVSNSESFGVAAVEAMACGIPVQASDAEGFAEVVEDGVTGLIAPKGDTEAIAGNMYKLLTDEKLREQMSHSGVERVKRLYNWEENVDLMEEIYNSLRA